MIIVRITVLVVALALLLATACSSEHAPAPPQSASVQPTTKPEPPQSASVAPTQSPSPTATAKPEARDLDIVTLLPFDAIPAVLDPEFISADEADAKLAEMFENHSRRDADAALLAGGDGPDDALVLGVSINGDSRAYYIPTLSRVEIVNDDVGGQPLAATW